MTIALPNTCAPEHTRTRVDEACREVLLWLHAGRRMPDLLPNVAPHVLRLHRKRLANCFRDQALPFGFTLWMCNWGTPRDALWLGEWHHGPDPVRDFQGEGAHDYGDARILACAALLRHDWSRIRLSI